MLRTMRWIIFMLLMAGAPGSRVAAQDALPHHQQPAGNN